MLRSRDQWEEYLMTKEQEHEKDIVSRALREQQLNREIYKLGLELQEKDREIQRLNDMLGIFKGVAEKLFLNHSKAD